MGIHSSTQPSISRKRCKLLCSINFLLELKSDFPFVPTPPESSHKVSSWVYDRPHTDAGTEFSAAKALPGLAVPWSRGGARTRYLCWRLCLLWQWRLLSGSHRQFKSRAGYPAARRDENKRRIRDERGVRPGVVLKLWPRENHSQFLPKHRTT